MAINFIDVNRTAKYGGHLVQLADRLRAVREDLIEAVEKAGHMRADNGTNSALVASLFGLSPADHATGEAAYGVLTSALSALNDAAIITLIERVG